LASAHAVDREFRVLRALEKTRVPVPKAYAYCGNREIIGSAFYVMEFTDGRHFMDPRLPGVSVTKRPEMFRSMNECIENQLGSLWRT
jgi:aminoglycoside phosphotransferase (APT) family kinase protein